MKNEALFSVFKGKTVLVTGHTGFKGTWLTSWLLNLGAKVVGISIDIPSSPSHFEILSLKSKIIDYREDICDSFKIEKIILETKPDFLFHLAAQALVRKSYSNPIETWKTNVIGTLNILESLRKLNNNCTAVIITSDKCYENKEWNWGYRENDSLGGPDPYSASKGSAELVIQSHIKSFFAENSKIRIVSARAGNVIGGGDWALDRIVPDCVKNWSKNTFVELRNPHATRPWQHVLEPLSGYLVLASKLSKNVSLHGHAFNFGPDSNQNKSVLDLVEKMSEYWDKVNWKDLSKDYKGPYESGLLKLNCDKALALLNWNSVMNFDETVKMTTEWYRDFYEKTSEAKDLTTENIIAYTNFAKNKGLEWAI